MTKEFHGPLQVRKRTELENGVSSNEESIDNLDKQLSESKVKMFISLLNKQIFS